MATTPEFIEAYKRLNPEQKLAVDTIDGPVMVIAGPGTGKTQILALRIANILLKTDTSPDNILALTFTESGVFSMRKRLVSIIGNPAYKINIFTFHSFCNEVIKTYPEEFPRIIGANTASEIDQIKIIEDILNNASFKLLKPYGDILFYLRPALNIIRNLKREDISPKEFKKIVDQQEKDFALIPDLYHEKGAHKGKMKGEYTDLEKKIKKNAELQEIYEAYEDALKKQHLYDYEDMIVEVVKTLKSNNDLLLRLQEKYQYIHADEHQDANGAQNQILELLANFHPEPNIFIVGDEKQAIFRFQGASLENFLYFKKLYPHATIISLENNYRSTQEILDAAHSVIVNNKTNDQELRKKLIGGKNLKDQILLYEFSSPEFELQFIADDIAKHIAEGRNPDEITILYRNNKDALPLIRVLEKKAIPFVVQSDQDVFSDESINKLILLLQSINDIGNDVLFAHMLYIDFLGLTPLDAHKIIHFAGEKKIRLVDACRKEDLIKEAGIEEPQKILDCANKISSWTTVAKNKNILESLEIIIHESGFLKHILDLPGSQEKIAKLENFFGEVEKICENNKHAKLADLIVYIEILKKYNILIKTGVVGNREKAVQLMTAHKSKGLEFERVYIMGLADGSWGNKREIRHFHIPIKGMQSIGVDPLEDERRLFYVALTRAKKEIVLTYSTTGKNDQSLLPSQFLSEIDQELIKKIDVADFEQSFKQQPLQKYDRVQEASVPKLDQEYLRKLFLEQGLSVTALNKYLTCPWDYFFNNLLRIPSAKTKHQLYGIAIHASLREFFNAYAREEDITKKELVVLFHGHLSKMSLLKQDYEESLEKGTTSLEGYYDFYKNSWPRALITEYEINHVPLIFDVDGTSQQIFLRGILDKIELGEGDHVSVIDYKTAKPKTRNAIMGLTKTESVEYYRQLIFYKLLLKNTKYKMISGSIDFIEPDDKKNYHKESFEIQEEEVEKFVQLIQTTAKSIYTFEFWNSNCDDKKCEWCSLRSLFRVLIE